MPFVFLKEITDYNYYMRDTIPKYQDTLEGRRQPQICNGFPLAEDGIDGGKAHENLVPL